MEKYCHIKGCRYNHSHTTSGHYCGKCGKKGHGVIECNNNDSEYIRNLNFKYGDEILPKHKRCKIKNCPKFWEHTTEAHPCSSCNGIGHDIDNCPNFKITVGCPVCKQTNTLSKQFIGLYGLEMKCCICMENNVDVLFPQCKHLNSCLSCCKRLVNVNDQHQDPLSVFMDEDDFDISQYGIDIDYVKNEFNKINQDNIFTIVYAGMGCEMYIRRDTKDSKLKTFFMHTDSWGQYGIDADERPFIKLFTEDYKQVTILKN